MELTHDWRGFRKVFFDEHRLNPAKERITEGPIYIVVDQETIITAFAEHEDLSDWIGSSFIDFLSRNHQRRIVTFDREGLENTMGQAMSLPHYFEQIEFFRSKARPSVPVLSKGKNPLQKARLKTGGKPLPMDYRRHFLLQGLATWWAKVLPSTFALLIRKTDESGVYEDFVLTVRNGKVDSYFRPDLTHLSRDRRDELAAVVRHLSEKHILPVQGIQVSASQWSEWMNEAEPWKRVFRSIRRKETRLVPFRFGVFTLLMLRSALKI